MYTSMMDNIKRNRCRKRQYCKLCCSTGVGEEGIGDSLEKGLSNPELSLQPEPLQSGDDQTHERPCDKAGFRCHDHVLNVIPLFTCQRV